MAKVLLFILVVIMAPSSSIAGKRFAKPDEGMALNQSFVVLEDGSFFAAKDKKRVNGSRVYMEDEVAEIRKATIDRLDRERYWNDGAPPEKDALERYLEQKEKEKKQRAMQKVLADENWVKEDRLHSPKEEGG